MFKKLKEILKNNLISTFYHTFAETYFILILIVNNGNTLTGDDKNERERLERQL